MKRTALRRQSPKRAALMRERRAFVAEFLQGKRCEVAEAFWAELREDKWDQATNVSCFGPLTVHEVVKRSHGGAIVPGEKATAQGQIFMAVCSTHNTWIEDNPAEARKRGWA